MDSKNLDYETESVLKNANRAIIEAEISLKRTELFFAENNINQEKIIRYLESVYDSEELESFDKLVQRMMREAEEEVEKNLIQKNRLIGRSDLGGFRNKNFKKLI